MAQHAPDTVGTIRARPTGTAVSSSWRGLALPEARCVFLEMDVDACRAVAAAALDDATRLRFTPVVIEQVEEHRQDVVSIRRDAGTDGASSLTRFHASR